MVSSCIALSVFPINKNAWKWLCIEGHRGNMVGNMVMALPKPSKQRISAPFILKLANLSCNRLQNNVMVDESLRLSRRWDGWMDG